MQQQQPITPVDNTFKGVKAAAKTAGAKFPQVVAAQWALESGYGKHTSGKNNFFGLKGEGSERETKEFINGQWITIKAGFIDFPDLQTCVSYLVDRWYRDYQRFKGVNRATTAEECARLLVAEGYATDPQYAEKLIRIMRENG
jgi:flagellum-specific peptidoglycan hydrolase FlgJ